MREDVPNVREGAVTRIATQRKNPERVSIFLDGSFAIGVHRDVLLDHPIRRGERLDADRLAVMEAADERLRARSRAFDLLAYRARSEGELRRRLERDGFSEEASAFAVSRVRDLGYIDDEAFATEYASARFRSRGYGRRRLINELRQRGIAAPLAEQAAFRAVGDGDDERERALEFARKRMVRLQNEADPYRRRGKLYAALVRRGFETDLIRSVIDEVIDTAQS